MSDPSPDDPAAFETPGTLTLFGFDARPATVRLLPRTRSWRLGGALRIVATGVVAAPLVGLLPPHVPWILGAVGTSAFLARRRWSERFTLIHMAGTCPRCGGAVSVRPGRLRSPHPVPCEGCHHEVSLDVPAAPLVAEV